jgi:hypothetical protein
VQRDPTILRRWVLFGVLGLGGLLAAIVLLAGLTSFKSVSQGEVCVIGDGGPLDDRKVSKVRQPGSGVETVGIFNHQRCFPANERHYTLSSDPAAADSKTVDVVQVPTKDAVEVFIEGQFRFLSPPTGRRSRTSTAATGRAPSAASTRTTATRGGTTSSPRSSASRA